MTDGLHPPTRVLSLTVNGAAVEVPDTGDTLLGLVRDHLGLDGAKDGCSPQGQCGCCTVLVDGQPRVACVTPARRVNGRSVTTIEGLDAARRARWGEAFCATGGSQCGFCTPGIVLRLDALSQREGQERSGRTSAAVESLPGAERPVPVEQALMAHLCRCTGWQSILEAWSHFVGAGSPDPDRDLAAAGQRAEIEGGSPQRVSPEVALGAGGFAADTAPDGALRAVADAEGGWVVGETLAEARKASGKTQGRRTTVDHGWPLNVPSGEWDAELRTTWVEPAYLETDASWCEPGGEPASPLANGGAFGGKSASPIVAAARSLADEHQRPVLVLASREDTVRWGPKRPPVAGGAQADGIGVLRVRATPGVVEAVAAVAPDLVVEQVEVPGPPTSMEVRAAGWAEAVVLLAGARREVGTVVAPNGAEARATVTEAGISVWVSCGDPLDHVMLRSYCIGAAHMAYSWVTSEALTVDADGLPCDLTIRSFGITRAADMPPVVVEIEADEARPVNGSDAVFAAVAAATWLNRGCSRDWPVGHEPS